MERKNYLDVAKLLAVLCVIHNHAGITYLPVKQTIAAFHMPVFFIICGIVSSDRQLHGKEWLGFIEKRAKSLLVPYVLWAMIYTQSFKGPFWQNVLYGTNQSLGRAGTNQVLWFLPCMFAAVLFFEIWKRVFANRFHKVILSFMRGGSILACAVASIVLGKLGGNKRSRLTLL